MPLMVLLSSSAQALNWNNQSNGAHFEAIRGTIRVRSGHRLATARAFQLAAKAAAADPGLTACFKNALVDRLSCAIEQLTKAAKARLDRSGDFETGEFGLEAPFSSPPDFRLRTPDWRSLLLQDLLDLFHVLAQIAVLDHFSEALVRVLLE